MYIFGSVTVLLYFHIKYLYSIPLEKLPNRKYFLVQGVAVCLNASLSRRLEPSIQQNVMHIIQFLPQRCWCKYDASRLYSKYVLFRYTSSVCLRFKAIIVASLSFDRDFDTFNKQPSFLFKMLLSTKTIHDTILNKVILY